MKKILSPRLMLINAMAVFGTIGLLVRHSPVTSGELALYRAMLAAMMLGTFFLVTGQKLHLKGLGKELALLLISGGAMVFIWKYLIAPMGGAWGIYELLPSFIVASIFIVVVSLCTKAPSEEVLADFDKYQAEMQK